MVYLVGSRIKSPGIDYSVGLTSFFWLSGIELLDLTSSCSWTESVGSRHSLLNSTSVLMSWQMPLGRGSGKKRSALRGCRPLFSLGNVSGRCRRALARGIGQSNEPRSVSIAQQSVENHRSGKKSLTSLCACFEGSPKAAANICAIICLRL